MPTPTLACPKCGSGNDAAATFCQSCGQELGDPQLRATASAWDKTVPVGTAMAMLERVRMATLGDYDIAAELGRGGMAAVYLAHDLRLDRKVAIKVMLPELTTTEDMVERFRREARTAGNLSHPHIIPIHQVYDENGLVFFVMKFVEGRSLDSIVREKGRLPIKMVETILSQTASALGYAHRKGVIHRDIKPANLMLDEDGWAVLTDFGIAKVVDAANLTATQATMGTPYYMSPEQCSAKPVTGASDQYSLGVACYELLTGSPPFVGDSLMDVMSGHFFRAPASVREQRPDCPPELEAIILRMLAKEPAERFPSCDDLVSVLKATPLQLDDPVRTQMIDLAKSGAALRAKVSVPISPLPPVRKRPSASARPAVTEPVRAPVRTNAGRNIAVALGVVALAGVGYWQFAPRSNSGDSGVQGDAGQPNAPVVPSSNPVATVADPVPLAAAPPPREDTAPTVRRPPSRPQTLQLPAPTTSEAAPPSAAVTQPAPATTTPSVAGETTPPLSTPDPGTAAAAPVDGRILLGTRTSDALYYINGSPQSILANGRLSTLTVRAGNVRLSIAAEGCVRWDTTLTVTAGALTRVGYRDLNCSRTP